MQQARRKQFDTGPAKPFPFPSLPFPSPPPCLPLKVGPLNQARGSGGAL